MQASRTCFRCFCTYINISTVTTLPYHFYIFLEDFIIFYILHESQVSFFMSFFSNGNFTIHLSDSRETFFICNVSKFRIIQAPFFIFTCCSCFQVFQCSTDYAGRIAGSNFYHSTFQPLEHSLGMFLFLISSFHKNSRNLLEAFFLCYTGKISVTHSCL